MEVHAAGVGVGLPEGEVGQPLGLGPAAVGEDVQAPQVVPVKEVDPSVRAARDSGGHPEGPHPEVLHLDGIGDVILVAPQVPDRPGFPHFLHPGAVPAVGERGGPHSRARDPDWPVVRIPRNGALPIREEVPVALVGVALAVRIGGVLRRDLAGGRVLKSRGCSPLWAIGGPCPKTSHT